jgi:hypothetical protein
MCSGPIRGLTPRTAMLVGRLVLPCLGIVWFPGRHAGQWCGGRGCEDEVIVVIHKDCPLHKIVRKPMDDVLGDQ